MVTPAQEVSTLGRVVSVDLMEGRVLSSEWGAGVGLSVIDPESGIERLWVEELQGTVAKARFVDPYTVLVWVKEEGLLVLDLLDPDRPVVLDQLGVDSFANSESVKEMEENESTMMTVLEWKEWTYHEGRFAVINHEGQVWTSGFMCDP